MFNNFFKSKNIFFYLIKFALIISSTCFANNQELILSFDRAKWISLSYNKIQANIVDFSDLSLKVKVQSSAGPIVYKLDQAKNVLGFTVKGKLEGSKKIEQNSFDEDSILRLGLVATGTQTLTGPKKWLAADWVKKLFSLAPEGLGLDKIYLFNISNRQDQISKKREHPKSDLIVEKVIAYQNDQGAFELNYKLDEPINTAAIWISIDGDDTKSEFEITLSQIKLLISQ